MPLDTPQTPKPLLTNVGHYEKLKVVENLMKDVLAEENIKELNLFPELQEDRERYRQMEYSLPSKALETVYSHTWSQSQRFNQFQKGVSLSSK